MDGESVASRGVGRPGQAIEFVIQEFAHIYSCVFNRAGVDGFKDAPAPAK